jgi:unsaturated chondroitin disaccharide hydrolase
MPAWARSDADPGEHEALLTHATGNKPWNENIDVSLIYGDCFFDYYFYEALLKVMGAGEQLSGRMMAEANA